MIFTTLFLFYENISVSILRDWRQPKARIEAFCSVCGKTISSKKNLQRHMMTHEESNVQQVHAGLGKPIKGNIEDKKMKEIAEYAVNTR